MCHISHSMHFGFASLKGYGAAYRETDEAQRDILAPLSQRQETCPIRTFLGITFVRLIQTEGGGSSRWSGAAAKSWLSLKARPWLSLSGHIAVARRLPSVAVWHTQSWHWMFCPKPVMGVVSVPYSQVYQGKHCLRLMTHHDHSWILINSKFLKCTCMSIASV